MSCENQLEGILLLEDVDACGGATLKRSGMDAEELGNSEGENTIGASLTLAGLLNALDGVATREGHM